MFKTEFSVRSGVVVHRVVTKHFRDVSADKDDVVRGVRALRSRMSLLFHVPIMSLELPRISLVSRDVLLLPYQ